MGLETKACRDVVPRTFWQVMLREHFFLVSRWWLYGLITGIKVIGTKISSDKASEHAWILV